MTLKWHKNRCLLMAGIGIAAMTAAAWGQNCGDPGAGNCCESNGSPACDDADCCEAVCAAQPFCCDVLWDGGCAADAEDFCPDLCGANPNGACCFPDTSCTELTLEECNDMGGEFQGGGTDCAGVECTGFPGCPAGGTLEGEPCGQDPDVVNGGCNSTPNVFSDVECGDIICGTIFAEEGTRDTDWYQITVNETTTITATLDSDFTPLFATLTGVCDAPAIDQDGSATGEITIALSAGETATFFVSTDGVFEGIPCGSGMNNYVLEFNCEAGAPGACCLEDGSCVQVDDPADCTAQNGAFQGGGTDCADVTCAGPPECPPEGVQEGEPCGQDPDVVNGGCNSTPNVFSDLECGDIICGSAFAEGGTRDTDWYQISVDETTTVTATLDASFTPLFATLTGVCDAPVIDQDGSDDGELVIVIPAGETATIFVAPSVFEGIPCGSGMNDYQLEIACETGAPDSACCLPDGTCVDVEVPQDCVDMGGIFQGVGVPCSEVTCPLPTECPPNGIDEGEPCGQSPDVVNGGCNSTPNVFTQVECNDVICGQAHAEGGTRDTDWYQLTVEETTTVTVTLESEFDPLFATITGVCAAPAIGQDGSDDGELVIVIPAGETATVFVSTAVFDGVPCGTSNDYVLEFDCAGGEVPGACCLPDGSCVNVDDVSDCTAQGGAFQGEDTDCADVACPGPVACPAGGVDEGEPCGQDPDVFNGGCNSTPNVFSDVVCGDVICGTVFNNGEIRDTDWYQVTVSEETEITVLLEAEFDYAFFKITGVCGAPAVEIDGSVSGEITTTLDPGTHTFFVSTAAFEGTPCGSDNEYVLSFLCEGGCIDISDCPDADNSGTVDSPDLNLVLGAFGCVGPDCDGDYNCDGATDSADLNAVLGTFGSDCP